MSDIDVFMQITSNGPEGIELLADAISNPYRRTNV